MILYLDTSAVVRQLYEDWERCSIVEITAALVRRAGGLAKRHKLRGHDAVHSGSSLAPYWRERGS